MMKRKPITRSSIGTSPSFVSSRRLRNGFSAVSWRPTKASVSKPPERRSPLTRPMLTQSRRFSWHSDLPTGGAELSRAAGRRGSFVDRAPAASDRPSARLASATPRRPTGAGLRRASGRRGVSHGVKTSAGLIDRTARTTTEVKAKDWPIACRTWEGRKSPVAQSCVRPVASTMAKQAAMLSYIDGFLAAAVGALGCLMLTALLRRH
jgi:hypothetical protein